MLYRFETNKQHDACILALMDTGLYGRTREEVLKRLLDAALQNCVKEGTIKQPSGYNKDEGYVSGKG